MAEFSSFAAIPEVSLSAGNLYPLLEELVLMFRTVIRGLTGSWISLLPFRTCRWTRRPCTASCSISWGTRQKLWGGNQAQAGARVVIRAYLDSKQENLYVEIEDNGPGLPEEDAARLFEPYYSRKQGGTGLGLSIVRALVQDHGGSIVAENAPEGGAVTRMDFSWV